MEVQTVAGPVDSADLGFTLMHEHVISADPEILAKTRKGPPAMHTDAVLGYRRPAMLGGPVYVEPVTIGLKTGVITQGDA